MKRWLLGVALLCVLVIWVGGALNWAEWFTLVGMAIVIVCVWVTYEARHPLDEPRDQTLYVPEDWDWPEDDVSHVRHGGLGR